MAKKLSHLSLSRPISFEDFAPKTKKKQIAHSFVRV